MDRIVLYLERCPQWLNEQSFDFHVYRIQSAEGLIYSPILHIFRSEEANKAFSAAVQMHDVLVKAWAMWGDYLENIFVKDRQLHLGVSAITCYLHACRHQNESKSRKYLAKVRSPAFVFLS